LYGYEIWPHTLNKKINAQKITGLKNGDITLSSKHYIFYCYSRQLRMYGELEETIKIHKLYWWGSDTWKPDKEMLG
jgi:hypothetical protein